MIAFEDKIVSSLKDAMRAKDQVKMDCLRAMKSALTYKDDEKKGTGVTEEEALSVFTKLINQRKEAIEQYEKAGRIESASKEKYEIEVIQAYLPKALNAAEVEALIKDCIAATAAKGAADMGKVMKELKPKTAGRADGKLVADLVKKILG